MDLELTNKVAVITGSSRGLGLASARALLDEGCSVVICARGKVQLEASAKELKVRSDESRVLAVSCLLYTSPSPRDGLLSRMPSSA